MVGVCSLKVLLLSMSSLLLRIASPSQYDSYTKDRITIAAATLVTAARSWCQGYPHCRDP